MNPNHLLNLQDMDQGWASLRQWVAAHPRLVFALLDLIQPGKDPESAWAALSGPESSATVRAMVLTLAAGALAEALVRFDALEQEDGR